MKKSMCITYEVDGSLYVNLTNKCSNRCEFCIRNNGDGAYGSDSLWLEREPTLEEALASVFSRDLEKYPELIAYLKSRRLYVNEIVEESEEM